MMKKLYYIPTLLKSALIYRMPYLYKCLEIKPRTAVIMLTNRCNLKCIMCKQWRMPSHKELSIEDWKRIIKGLKRVGIKNIHFTGGEPLLRQDLCELIQYSSQNGSEVGITSNGLLLTKGLLDNLIKSGLRSIAISVDALETEFEQLRGVPNSFSRVKNALSLVSNARKDGKVKAYINFTLMKNTIEGFKEVKALMDKLGLPIAICLLDKNSSIFEVKENKDVFWIKSQNDLRRLNTLLSFIKEEKIRKSRSLILNFPALDFIAAYFENPLQKEIPCISSQDKIFIDPYGDILGGCLSMGSFGNVNERPIEELLKEARYKKAKRNMFYKNCSGCSCGYLFNSRYFMPLAGKDLLMRLKYLVNKNDSREISDNRSYKE